MRVAERADGAEPDEPHQPALPDQPAFGFPRTPGAIARRVVQIVASLGIAAALLGWGLPYLTRTSWATIIEIVTGIGWAAFLPLLCLMFTGLYCYTFTLTASLPGLRHHQALMVNLSGSAASNAFPGGGALGGVLTYAMYRSWGFTYGSITTSIVVTMVWNVLARVILPVLAALVLVTGGGSVPAAMAQGAIAGGAGGALLAGALICVIASERAARSVGRGIDRLGGPLLKRVVRTSAEPDIEKLTLALRATIIDLVRTRWLALTLGLAGFMGIYFVLFRQCLAAVGVDLSWQHAFAAYAVGRLLTAVPVTPGGIGVAEAGAAAVMLALGVPGDATAAAVTLFALFSFLLEIPFGAIAVTIWLNTRPQRGLLRPESSRST